MKQPTRSPLLQIFILTLVIASTQCQEAPNEALVVPLLAQGDTTFRNELCAVASEYIAGNRSIGDALRDVGITTALWRGEFVNWKFTEDGKRILDPDYAGLVPALLDEVCLRAQCRWRKTYADPSYDDMPPGASFTDLLIWTTNMYDLSADWWMRSVERLQAGATFTEPWYDATIIMVTAQQISEETQSDRFSDWGWLAPFDRAVWFMILVTIFLSSGVYWLLHRLDPLRRQTDMDPIETTWKFATAAAGQFEFDPQTGPSRLFTFSIAFWSLLIVTAYTANLASFLVIRSQKSGFQVQSVAQSVQLNRRMCVWRASQTDDSITKAFPTYASSPRFIRTSQRGVYEGLRNGECEIALTEMSTWDVFQNDQEVNPDCNLQWIGRPFQNIPASFGVKSDAGDLCTSLLRDVFNLHLHNMQVDGTIDRLWREHAAFSATVDCVESDLFTVEEDDVDLSEATHRQLKVAIKSGGGEGSAVAGDSDGEAVKLTLTNMGGVFFVHGILSGISVLFALGSLAMFKWQEKGSAQEPIADPQSPPSQQKLPDRRPSLDHTETLHLSQRMDVAESSNSSDVENEIRPQIEESSGTESNGNDQRHSIGADDLRADLFWQLRIMEEKIMAKLEEKKLQ